MLCTSKGVTTGEHAYCRHLLNGMTVARRQLSTSPIDVPEVSQQTMPAPEWSRFFGKVDGPLNPCTGE